MTRASRICSGVNIPSTVYVFVGATANFIGSIPATDVQNDQAGIKARTGDQDEYANLSLTLLPSGC